MSWCPHECDLCYKEAVQFFLANGRPYALCPDHQNDEDVPLWTPLAREEYEVALVLCS